MIADRLGVLDCKGVLLLFFIFTLIGSKFQKSKIKEKLR